MNQKIKMVIKDLFAVITVLLLASCTSRAQPAGIGMGTGMGMGPNAGSASRTDSFNSNGERIYFTATSERGTEITYVGGPSSNGGMTLAPGASAGVGNGRLACDSCHGPGGQGGTHNMGMMQTMTAKDIRWSALQGEFDAEKFRLAVVKGQDPDGTQLSMDMPRWNIGDDDLADLIVYLKTLP
ncbi:MAG: c-type cytochrome [Anaerolineales bacterium]|nr:c-type cytochrome [Anaerolineales bacterium]